MGLLEDDVPPAYDPSEQDVIIDEFVKLLKLVTKDGGRKRAKGEKPPWWKDRAHEAAIFSHLNAWKHDQLVDPDSGTHPLVHLAWRCLAIAYQQTRGMVEPVKRTTITPTKIGVGLEITPEILRELQQPQRAWDDPIMRVLK